MSGVHRFLSRREKKNATQSSPQQRRTGKVCLPHFLLLLHALLCIVQSHYDEIQGNCAWREVVCLFPQTRQVGAVVTGGWL
ncbi:hypothetical protein EJ03DRAFT_323471 [Teratosphaeria nubilosa]|uniref:Uncharacterized protein n=1 Tax=Teratosphaeria nubilosa TaxID=161662 RepID=A0A6G1LKY1_9PEZI|nr:hypothetical protein EJ03DRAFT_323471 [Teratosphaeria nubilosa]